MLPSQQQAAHNLNQTMVYMFFDPDTQKYLDQRAASITPPTSLLEVGKEYGIIIKVIPDQGTNTGVGGYVDFYIPNGTQVVDVGYILPGSNPSDGITLGWDKVPMKGQALMPDVGAGGESKFDLTGVTRTNPFGVTSTVVNASNANLGTLPAIYGDTGIFYSTIPETAWGSYSNGQVIDQVNKLVNNSGDTVGYRTVLKGILNEWDAWQMAAYGLSSTNNSSYPANAIIDSNERGYTPWGMANMVPGPQSGYAWEFDKDVWDGNSAVTPQKNRADLAWQVGPWNRIKYPGSQFATDPPGHRGATIHAVGGDASNLGASMPLPATTGQANSTPNAVRWAVGQLTYNTPEYVWLKLKVNDLAAIMNSSGCPIFNADSIGGDAGGDSGGKDHIWRYYDPTDFQWNGCLALGKPATKEVVKVGDYYQYKIKMYNAGNNDFANAVIQDTLGSGVTYISATPAPSVVTSTTLQWNVSPFLRGQMFEATVTVKASSTGLLNNKVCTVGTVSSGPAGSGTTVNTCSGDTTPSGSVPLLKQNKSIDKTSIAPGGSVQWTIDVENIGTGPTGTPIKIEDHVPSGFTYQSLNSVLLNGANVTAATTVSGTPQDPIFSVAYPLQAGQKLLIAFTAVSDPNINPGSYCNYYTNYAPSIPLTTGLLACVAVGGGAIGDTVWRDWSNDGTQDAGEEGLPGVDVKLYSGACPPAGSAIQTKTTDATGFYRFTGLTNGTYCVDPVDPGATGGAPLGYTLTTSNDPKTVTLTSAAPQDYTADFGYKPGGAGSIGDTVFEDINNNGVFDGADIGIGGAQVLLYEDTNGNGILDAGSDAQVATTTTAAGGLYSFTGLATGISYLVYVDPADAAVDNQFTGPYVASTPDPQPVPNLSGAYDAADIGFWAVQPGSIGDQVFLDNNKNGIYDAGDLPIPNVTVDLYLDGVLLKTTTSDATGQYLFDQLGAGSYTVVVSATDPDVPAGYIPSVIKIDKVLAPNETYLNADFPFVAGLAKTVDKNYATTGNTLNFSLKPYYPGSELLSDVRVIDPIPTGTTYVNNSANATGGTYGAYQFFAAVPGQDTSGGPAGTATLDTALSVGANYVVKGASVNVTLNVKSTAAVSVVSPGALGWTGGAATCTGPTPSTGNVPSGGSGLNFVWACTLNDVGEYTFSNDASDASGDWSWPSADSASVLSSPGGGPNVVTWNLGQQQPGRAGPEPGHRLRWRASTPSAAATPRSSRPTTLPGSSKAQPTNGIEKGGSLTGDGAGTLLGARRELEVVL